MKLAVTIELYAYWNRLRGARSAPERNDVDPSAIRGVLADTFVLDFDKKRGFPFRIAGSRANAIFLKELRGLSFLELWRGADRAELDSVLHCIAELHRRRSAGVPHRRAGPAAGSWGDRHRGDSVAPSPSRLDPFPPSRGLGHAARVTTP